MMKIFPTLGYLFAILAIFVALFLGFGVQTAYPPSMAKTDELVQQMQTTAEHASYSKVVIESKLLQEMVRVTLLSRKEYQRLEHNEIVYVVMLLVSSLYLLVLLPQIQLKNKRTVQPTPPE